MGACLCHMHVWRLEDRCEESDSTSHHVGAEDGTLVTRLGSGCPQSPSHLDWQQVSSVIKPHCCTFLSLSFFPFLDRLSFCIHCAPQAVLELLILLLIPRAWIIGMSCYKHFHLFIFCNGWVVNPESHTCEVSALPLNWSLLDGLSCLFV